MVAIICKLISYGAADNLWRAFESQGIPCKLLCFRHDKKRGKAGTLLTKKNKEFWLAQLKKESTYTIIVSANTLVMFDIFLGGVGKDKFQFNHLAKYLRSFKNTPAVFVTGTKYRDNYQKFNNLLDRLKIRFRFALSDLVKYHPNHIQLLHTMEYPNFSTKKSKVFTVSHSPGSELRSKIYKGTPEIEKGVRMAEEKVKFTYDHISGVKTHWCLTKKAKSHVFIDQIETSIGGIGKNGMEAIALDCVTMSSWTSFQPNDFYPPHPVLVVRNANQVRNHLVSLAQNEKLYEKIKNRTSKWKKHIGYENTVNYIQSVLGDEFRW